MAKVYFEPNKTIKYVGSKARVFKYSLVKPKPLLKKGDIVIVDKKTAFTLVKKGFGDFIEVETIEFVKSDVKAVDELAKMEEQLLAFKNENNSLFAKNVELMKELTQLKQGS